MPLRAVANALLSAGNTTDLTRLRQTSISLSPAQAGAPLFPAVLPAAVPSTTLVNFTTMDRALENAYSRQASVEFEQQLGARTTVSLAYQYVRGVHLLMQVNQNVPSCPASGGNNGCRPIPLRQQHAVLVRADSNYHGLHLSLVQRPDLGRLPRHTYTYSKSMNNVGGNFFQLADRSVRPLEGLGTFGR